MWKLLARRMHFSTTLRPPPLLLCADFDETITERDTTSLLLQLAPDVAVQEQVVQQFNKELGALITGYEAVWRQERHDGCFDAGRLRTFLEDFAAVDLRSVRRVVNTRALRGIRRSEIAEAAKSVQVRASCVEALGLAYQWGVISANWSEELVRQVLIHGGVSVQETDQVIANELVMSDLGTSTGEINMRVQSAMDKARWVAALRSMHVTRQANVVYVGDSANDLLALLEADVGIWLASDRHTSSSKLLHQLVEHYGVNMHPLGRYGSIADCVAASDLQQEAADGKSLIFTAENWSQITTAMRARLQQRQC